MFDQPRASQKSTPPRVLMVDVGGTNVKMMRSGHPKEMRKIPSTANLTARGLVAQVRASVKDWPYDRVTLGFPGIVRAGKALADPLNLGRGWKGTDFGRLMGKPVRVVNDAILQGLAHYRGGRMLFIGFGTSIACAIGIDGVITNIELGWVRLARRVRLMDRLSKKALRKRGRAKWRRDVRVAIKLLQNLFAPEYTVIGGGNAKHLKRLPEKCERATNRDALKGAERAWSAGAGEIQSSWRVTIPGSKSRRT
jgi:polyphosphate glucokinase